MLKYDLISLKACRKKAKHNKKYIKKAYDSCISLVLLFKNIKDKRQKTAEKKKREI